MRISDWSSDVCSSDLRRCLDTSHRGDGLGRNYSASSGGWLVAGRNRGNIGRRVMALLASVAMSANGLAEIGRASCRGRVCQYVYISVVAVSFQNNRKYILINIYLLYNLKQKNY